MYLNLLCLYLMFSFLVGCVSSPPRIEDVKPSGLELKHKYFEVMYDKENMLPRYVVYTLKKEDLNGPGDRKNLKFKPDPILRELGYPVVVDADLTNSGYHRGHMAPAEDFSRSQEAIVSTFVTTNMVPQIKNFNSGPWAQLERQVRGWACGEEEVVIITGPVIEPDLKKIKGKMSIPNKIFKIVLDETPPKKHIAFIYTQKDVRDVRPEQRKVNLEILKTEPGINDILNYYIEPQYASSGIEEWRNCK